MTTLIALIPFIAKFLISFSLYTYFVARWLGHNILDWKLLLITLYMSIAIKFKHSALLFSLLFVYLFLTGELNANLLR
jgi:hypothetical protein